MFLIERLDALIEQGRRFPGTNAVMVDKVAATDLIEQLRVAVPEEGLGIAVKVQDGGIRAGDAAAVRVLDQLGLLNPSEARKLEAFRCSPIHNTLGETVGELSANFTLET